MGEMFRSVGIKPDGTLKVEKAGRGNHPLCGQRKTVFDRHLGTCYNVGDERFPWQFALCTPLHYIRQVKSRFFAECTSRPCRVQTVYMPVSLILQDLQKFLSRQTKTKSLQHKCGRSPVTHPDRKWHGMCQGKTTRGINLRTRIHLNQRSSF